MTEFNGVKRRTRGAYKVLYQKTRQIVVSLDPGDLITFRETGRRQAWSLPADLAFKYAVRLQARSGKEKDQ